MPRIARKLLRWGLSMPTVTPTPLEVSTSTFTTVPSRPSVKPFDAAIARAAAIACGSLLLMR